MLANANACTSQFRPVLQKGSRVIDVAAVVHYSRPGLVGRFNLELKRAEFRGPPGLFCEDLLFLFPFLLRWRVRIASEAHRWPLERETVQFGINPSSL